MNTLDSKGAIEQIDSKGMRKWMHEFSDQLKHAEEIGQAFTVDPCLTKGITKIVFSGLGGSAIGADFVKTYLNYEISIPILVNRHYQLPEYVDDKTMLIVSSYSGDTEETISALKDGMRRKAKIIAISTGGELGRQAERHQFPFIKIPSSFSPRAAIGYSVVPLLIMLSKLGFPKAYRADELKEAQTLTRRLSEKEYGIDIPFERNSAKQLAQKCFKKYVIIYSGPDYFDVAGLRWRGQIEENSKAIASHHVLPEMNHNELVGWQNPAHLLKESVVFFLRDSSDHKRVRIRMDLTRDVIKRLAGEVIEVQSRGKGLLARMFSLIYLGDWISFYLAILYGVDPTPVEVINYLKSELAREPIS